MINKRLLSRLEGVKEPFATKIYARGAFLAGKQPLPWEEVSANEKDFFRQLAADTLFTLQLFEEAETIERLVHL